MKFHDRIDALAKDPDFVKDAQFMGSLPDETNEELIKRVVVVFRRMADRFERVLMDHALETRDQKESPAP